MIDIGLIGLAVMGENLVLNIEDKGFSVAVYNRTPEKIDSFLKGRAKNKNISGAYSLKDLCSSLKAPRKIMLLVKAGKPVDGLIDQLVPYLEEGDIIIDGGNSHYLDTIRRTKYIENKGLLFVGAGVSGGEEGALNGASIMPGGSYKAWKYIKPIFEKIAARTVSKDPCCKWVGQDGSGHFVKMVHNGIEYGDMQMIAETYHILKEGLGLSNDEMSHIFNTWNHSELNSYLIEITGEILSYKNDEGQAVIDLILDVSGQKGTGKWTAISAFDYGQPLTLIAEAVFARCLSSLKEQRVIASSILNGPNVNFNGNKEEMIKHLKQALYASKIISYAQGFQLLLSASKKYNWNLNYGDIASMWRGGCIIRSIFLDKIKDAFDKNEQLTNLVLDPFFKKAIDQAQESWRYVIITSISLGIPMPAITSALSYYDSYRTNQLPANLIQAQRDFFGAHTYEQVDKPRGEFYHTNWTGKGGDTSSTTYEV